MSPCSKTGHPGSCSSALCGAHSPRKQGLPWSWVRKPRPAEGRLGPGLGVVVTEDMRPAALQGQAQVGAPCTCPVPGSTPSGIMVSSGHHLIPVMQPPAQTQLFSVGKCSPRGRPLPRPLGHRRAGGTAIWPQQDLPALQVTESQEPVGVSRGQRAGCPCGCDEGKPETQRVAAVPQGGARAPALGNL